MPPPAPADRPTPIESPPRRAATRVTLSVEFIIAMGRQPKGPSGNNCAILAADASRLAALLVGHMRPACSLLAPCDPGASAPRNDARISGRALSVDPFNGVHDPLSPASVWMAL